jgi:hypothetical protein
MRMRCVHEYLSTLSGSQWQCTGQIGKWTDGDQQPPGILGVRLHFPWQSDTWRRWSSPRRRRRWRARREKTTKYSPKAYLDLAALESAHRFLRHLALIPRSRQGRQYYISTPFTTFREIYFWKTNRRRRKMSRRTIIQPKVNAFTNWSAAFNHCSRRQLSTNQDNSLNSKEPERIN